MKVYAALGSAPVHWGSTAREAKHREMLVSFFDAGRAFTNLML